VSTRSSLAANAVSAGAACYAGPVQSSVRGWRVAGGCGRVAAARLALLALLSVAACSSDPDEGWVSYDTRVLGDGGARRGRRLPTPTYAGSIGVVGEGCASLELRAEPTTREADVVFIIDNSGSMSDEIALVQERMNEFSEQIAEADVDAHIVLISQERSEPVDPVFGELFELGICIAAPLGSGDCPADSREPEYVHLPWVVGSNDALQLLLDGYANWSQGLRPAAETAIVVITDDNAFLADVAESGQVAERFMEELADLDPALAQRLRFHGIFSRTLCSQAAAQGEVYEQLVRRTQGVAGDLCRRDFQRVFDAVAESLIAGASLGCEWEIPPAPMGEELLFGQVAVRYTPSDTDKQELLPRVSGAHGCALADGWYYDDPADPERIAVCRKTCDRLRTDPDPLVDLIFGCDEAQQPD
jgi:hypothetical protein